MTPNEAAFKEIGRRPTLSAEAYEFYLQGEYYFKQRKSPADIEIGIGFLKKAIEKDTTFVLAMVQLAQMYREKVDYDKAFEIYEKALVIAEDNDNLSAMASIYNGIGGLHWRTDELNEALSYMKKAVNIFVSTGNLANEAMTLSNLGIISYSLGEVVRAINYLERALENDVKLGDKYGQGIRLSNIGYMYTEIKEYDKAVNYLMRSVKFFSDLDSQHGLSLAYDNIGKAYFYLNDFNSAIEFYSKAIQIFENIEMDVDLVISLSYKAMCYAEINNTSEALNTIELVKDNTRLLKEETIPVAAYWNLYKTYKLLNKDTPADTCLNKAYSMLMARADKIESAEQRKQFLNQIQDHKDIIQTWEAK